MQKTLAIIGIILLFVLGAIGGWWLRGTRIPNVEPVVKRDTLWQHDTVKFPVPVPEKKWIHDTTYIAVTDTIHLKDTIFVPIPRETTFYKDSLYEAWVTGFRATLDSVHVFKNTAYIEVQVPVEKIVRKRWGIGIQAGAGVQYGTIHKQMDVGPYLGVGISYNILNF